LGGVPVGGLSRQQARTQLERAYAVPVSVLYRDQEIRLSPDAVSFTVSTDAMLSKADELRSESRTFWAGFWDFLWRRPEQSYSVPLIADYSQELLTAWVADVAVRYDSLPGEASAHLDTLSLGDSSSGYMMDQDAAVEAIGSALMRPDNRQVTLTILQEDAERPGLDTLQSLIVDFLVSQKFRGVASVYVIDEKTGEQMSMDVDLRSGEPEMVTCDIALAGLSTMKIPLTIEYMRWLYEVLPYEYDVIESTLTKSSNLNANFMLRDIGGQDITQGTQVLNESMQYLGLENTFMVSGYDDEDPPIYYSTPAREAARSGNCINTQPDPYMQTTIPDLSVLMDMLYQCAEYDGGDLIAAYPGDITQQECQMMIDVMKQNTDGNLIRAGLPEDIEVAHKHGFTFDTITDAALVFSPGGDYSLVIGIWAQVDWVANLAFPLMEGISEATFNYFNPDLVNEPRRGLGDVLTPVDPNTGAPEPTEQP
jgi:hypothetical protein